METDPTHPSIDATTESEDQEFNFLDKDMDIKLFSEFTNWGPKQMVPFLHFIENIDENKPDYLKELKLM